MLLCGCMYLRSACLSDPALGASLIHPFPPVHWDSNAFRLNRLYGASVDGTQLGGTCGAAAWDPALVPQDLLAELGCVWNSYAGAF